MQNNETRWAREKKNPGDIRGSDSESGREERRDGDTWRRGQRNEEAKETGGGEGREERGASAFERELEGWIFFMKGFEGRAGRAPPPPSACP